MCIATFAPGARFTVVGPPGIDFEHQTPLSSRNEQPAPAAGWIRQTAGARRGVVTTCRVDRAGRCHAEGARVPLPQSDVSSTSRTAPCCGLRAPDCRPVRAGDAGAGRGRGDVERGSGRGGGRISAAMHTRPGASRSPRMASLQFPAPPVLLKPGFFSALPAWYLTARGGLKRIRPWRGPGIGSVVVIWPPPFSLC